VAINYTCEVKLFNGLYYDVTLLRHDSVGSALRIKTLMVHEDKIGQTIALMLRGESPFAIKSTGEGK